MLSGEFIQNFSKVLASRLKRVLGSLISKFQTAFVSGRELLDGAVVANDIINLVVRNKKECMLFKVDFEKAYDCVSWNFLRFMMKKMGFRSLWLKWMEACIFNSHILVLVNDSLTKDFKAGRGLRECDPLTRGRKLG